LDEKQRVFALKKALPAGMSFPYDFGFVPSSVAEDGDAFDLLVLMDEPAFPDCLLKCRIVGIIEAKQSEKKKTIRNDRIVAIEQDNHRVSAANSIGSSELKDRAKRKAD
jgi:inorganic pyrophosphatase